MAAKLSGPSGGRYDVAQNSTINVTPFVDVMLVLLIIFMVTAPMMATGVPIDLAKATSKPLDTPKKEPLLVSLDKAGKIYIGQTAYTLEDLGPKLQAIAKERDKDEAVQFSGDQGIDLPQLESHRFDQRCRL